jgi:hypothetical protein
MDPRHAGLYVFATPNCVMMEAPPFSETQYVEATTFFHGHILDVHACGPGQA